MACPCCMFMCCMPSSNSAVMSCCKPMSILHFYVHAACQWYMLHVHVNIAGSIPCSGTQHELEHAELTWTCSMALNAALIWTRSIEMDMQHEHRHVERRNELFSIDMDTDTQ
jgi:hypothetical protein